MSECAVCSSPAPHKCAGCKSVSYCSPAHQKEDWKAHKRVCPRLALETREFEKRLDQEAKKTKTRLAQEAHDSEELLLRITTCLAQNGYHTEVGVMVQLNKAFWWDEQIWDAFKDVPGAQGRTRLMNASRKGNMERLKYLLKRGARVNKWTNKVHSSLIFACLEGNLNVIRELCKRSDVDAVNPDEDGMTALMLISFVGNLEVVRLLCDLGANVNAARTCGLTALMNAVDRNHLEVVRELCKRGSFVNAVSIEDGTTILMLACQRGHLDIVRELCTWGVNVDAAHTSTNCTAVLWASWMGSTEIVRELCARKCSLSICLTVDPYGDSTTGYTSLMAAAREGHKDTVAALLSFGADPLVVDGDGSTAHDIALKYGHTDVCALLT